MFPELSSQVPSRKLPRLPSVCEHRGVSRTRAFSLSPFCWGTTWNHRKVWNNNQRSKPDRGDVEECWNMGSHSKRHAINTAKAAGLMERGWTTWACEKKCCTYYESVSASVHELKWACNSSECVLSVLLCASVSRTVILSRECCTCCNSEDAMLMHKPFPKKHTERWTHGQGNMDQGGGLLGKNPMSTPVPQRESFKDSPSL